MTIRGIFKDNRIDDRFLGWTDKYFGRWWNVAFNISLAVLFGGLSFIQEPGIWRDITVWCSGVNAGYAIIWLMYPRFTAARKREMEAEMNLVMASSINKTTRELYRSMVTIAEDDTLRELRESHTKRMQ